MTRRRLKPEEIPHRFQARFPPLVWDKLVDCAAKQKVSINTQLVRFVKQGLCSPLDSEIDAELPWLDRH